MVAWLQRVAVVWTLVLAWLTWRHWWPQHPAWAWGGAAFWLGGMAWAQLLHSLSALVQAPRHADGGPGWRDWAVAWWRETWAATLVFAWRQPWLEHAEPDHWPEPGESREFAGVVLVHGYLCNRALWVPWLRELRASGVPCTAITLRSVFGSIDEHVPQIEEAVQRMAAATGQRPLLVGHSMGGLAIRAWWRDWRRQAVKEGGAVPPLASRVQGIVTLGTPHQGTWLAHLSHVDCGRQMRQGSDWLNDLGRDEPAQDLELVHGWEAACDAVVYPQGASRWPGAHMHVVERVGHVSLVFHPAPLQALLIALGLASENPHALVANATSGPCKSRENPYIRAMPTVAERPSSPSIVPIRALEVSERAAIERHLLALGEGDRYLRFGYAANDDQIRRYVEGIRFDRDEVFGIFNRRLELIAMAHLAYAIEPDRRNSAEFGVSVSRHARGRGYGNRLFERAVMHARNQGVSLMYIHALSENVAMLKIARKGGATVVRDGSESEAHLELPPADFGSQMTELMEEQVAWTDYHLKAHTRHFRNFLRRLMVWR